MFNEKSLDFSMYDQTISSIFAGQPLLPKPPSRLRQRPCSFLVSLSSPCSILFNLSPSLSISLSPRHKHSSPVIFLLRLTNRCNRYQWRLGGDDKEDGSLLATGRLILATVEPCRSSHGSDENGSLRPPWVASQASNKFLSLLQSWWWPPFVTRVAGFKNELFEANCQNFESWSVPNKALFSGKSLNMLIMAKNDFQWYIIWLCL